MTSNPFKNSANLYLILLIHVIESRKRDFLGKKSACGSLEDLILLIHVIKSRKRDFFAKKGACGSLEDLSRAKTFHKI